MAEEGTWTKIKRSVKGFFSGAVKAAPMTLLYSGAAFGISAALGHYANPDLDFLKVSGNDAGKIVTRLMGSMVIGSGVSGVFNAYNTYNTPETSAGPAPALNGNSTSKAEGRGLSQKISKGGVTPSPTPNLRENQRNI